MALFPAYLSNMIYWLHKCGPVQLGSNLSRTFKINLTFLIICQMCLLSFSPVFSPDVSHHCKLSKLLAYHWDFLYPTTPVFSLVGFSFQWIFTFDFSILLPLPQFVFIDHACHSRVVISYPGFLIPSFENEGNWESHWFTCNFATETCIWKASYFLLQVMWL